MKISIIIPVYNSEKYIKECVDSILRQTYKNIEVLLIDDESQDDSAKICDEFAKKDSRVFVYHKKNGGTADSRNYGLERVTGDYTTFVDNDDYWASDNALEEIVEQLRETKADALLFDVMEYWENKDKFIRFSARCQRENIAFRERSEALTEIISKGLLYRAVWAKVVRTQLIRDNNLYFEKGIRNEDTEWTAKLLMCAQSYDWYEKVFYVYRKGTGIAQTDRKVSSKEVEDLINICTKYAQIARENLRDDNSFQKVFYSYLAYPYSVLMGQIRFVKDKKVKMRNKEIKKNAYILQYDLDPSVKMVKKVYNILGYALTTLILKIYMEIKY